MQWRQNYKPEQKHEMRPHRNYKYKHHGGMQCLQNYEPLTMTNVMVQKTTGHRACEFCNVQKTTRHDHIARRNVYKTMRNDHNTNGTTPGTV